MDEKSWVVVYTIQGRLSADMVRLLLESFDIPVTLNQESVAATYGLVAGDLGEVDILVPAARSEEASEILQAMDEGKLEAQDDEAENNDEDSINSLTN